MGIAARLYRPHVLAAAFGGYTFVVILVAWLFAADLRNPWFGPEPSRWIYTTYVIASATFLAGLGLLAFSIQNSFERRRSEVNRELGELLFDGGTGLSPKDVMDRPVRGEPDGGSDAMDLAMILETLGEVQNEQVLMVPPNLAKDEALAAHRLQLALLHRRDELGRRQRLLTTFLPGPAGVAVGILGISAAMLPAADGMLQSLYQLNTTLILGFAYLWMGLAAYFAVSILGVVSHLRTEYHSDEA